MFGMKQAIVASLEDDLKVVRGWRDTYWKNWQDAREKLARKESELSIVQEAYSGRLAEIDSLTEDVSYADARIDTLEYALNESKGLNQALEDENRDLVRQVELLNAVLGQLQIPVKLPARRR